MKSTHVLNVLLVGVLLLVLWGLYATRPTAVPTHPNTAKPIVTAGIYPIAFLAERIGGDAVDVRTITPAGAEPHDFEPSPKDMRAIADSKIILLAGGGLEPWEAQVTPSEGSSLVVLKTSLERNLPEGMITKDPHFWLSPSIMAEASRIVTESLTTSFPEHKSEFEDRETALLRDLFSLEKDFALGLATCTRRELVTGHDAFGYLAAAYELIPIGIAGVSPEAEPSPKDLATIAEIVKDHGVTTIFFEELSSPKFAQMLATETGVKTMALDPIEGFAQEDLGRGKNYITAMRANLSALQEALSCTKP